MPKTSKCKLIIWPKLVKSLSQVALIWDKKKATLNIRRLWLYSHDWAVLPTPLFYSGIPHLYTTMPSFMVWFLELFTPKMTASANVTWWSQNHQCPEKLLSLLPVPTEVTNPNNSSKKSGQYSYTKSAMRLLPPRSNGITANVHLWCWATNPQEWATPSVEGTAG